MPSNKLRQLQDIWVKRISTGTVTCARCQHLITQTTQWDLHQSQDRSTYLGPSHVTCNRPKARHTSHN